LKIVLGIGVLPLSLLGAQLAEYSRIYIVTIIIEYDAKYLCQKY